MIYEKCSELRKKSQSQVSRYNVLKIKIKAFHFSPIYSSNFNEL